MTKPRLILLAMLMSAASALAVDLKPFMIDWSKAAESAIDLSSFLDAPAGKAGHIRVSDQHLVTPDGSRFRIFGVNICASNCFPEKDLAPLIADDLARMGVNVVRFHHMEASWGRNIFKRERDDTRQLDPEMLDRLDFFISQLKQRGIYANLNLNVSRRYKPGDGVRDAELLGYAKGATYFNPRLIELQHEYATQLLTHRNSYTGNEYRIEPAVLCVEMVNENSLLEAWVGWRLVPREGKQDDTWGPLPASYTEELTDQYNSWLKTNVPAEDLRVIRQEAGVDLASGRVPRLMPNQFAKASKLRFHTEARFLMSVETDFFNGMKKLLKQELGVKSLLVGSADHNDGVSGYPHIRSNLVFDIVDGHGYWEHPRLGAETWIKNTPMVNDPLDSTVTQFARTPVVGRPYTISETNHPFPHEYACEGYPILTAYALMHDWDGIYWFDYGLGRKARPENGIQRSGWFDFSNDPVKMTNLAACALMWHRKDLRRAGEMIIRGYSEDAMIETLRMDRKERPFFTLGFARSTPLQHATRFTFDPSLTPTPFPSRASLGRIISDTGQLSWINADQKKGLVTIDTPCTQGLIGFMNPEVRTTHLAADVRNPFCTIILTSRDGKPITESARLLLVMTAKATNTGTTWKDDRQTLAEWGRGPIVIEPVTGTITLRNIGEVNAISCRPITAEGRIIPMRSKIEQAADGQWRIEVGEPPTTWRVIELMR